MALAGLTTSMLGAVADALDAVAARLRAVAGTTAAPFPGDAANGDGEGPGDAPRHGGPPAHWLKLAREGAPQLLRETLASGERAPGPVFQTQPGSRTHLPPGPAPIPAAGTVARRASPPPAPEAGPETVAAGHPRWPVPQAQVETMAGGGSCGPADPVANDSRGRRANPSENETVARSVADPADHARRPTLPVPLPVPLAASASDHPAPSATVADRPAPSPPTGAWTIAASTPPTPTPAVEDAASASSARHYGERFSHPAWPAAADPPGGAEAPSSTAADAACPWPSLPDEGELPRDAPGRWPRLPDEREESRRRAWNG